MKTYGCSQTLVHSDNSNYGYLQQNKVSKLTKTDHIPELDSKLHLYPNYWQLGTGTPIKRQAMAKITKFMVIHVRNLM